MAVIILITYAFAIIFLCVLVVFPRFRNKQLSALTKAARKAKTSFDNFFGVLRQWTHSSSTELRAGAVDALSVTKGYQWWLIGALAAICVPALLIVALRGQVELDAYADNQSQQDSIVGALLTGEQLVPPPPLPPEVFTTREVLAERPALASASRDWKLLEANFEQRLLRVFQRMHEQGYEMALLEGYRSPERQNQLAEQGTHVTNARAFQSYHQFGLAADCAFIRNGKLVISEREPWAMRGYELYGQAAEEAGLTWGGRWKMMDFGHVELRGIKKLPAKQFQ
jgi:peptidoglycan LD-endopeptidase CwlK